MSALLVSVAGCIGRNYIKIIQGKVKGSSSMFILRRSILLGILESSLSMTVWPSWMLVATKEGTGLGGGR
jgi:hypothetical protein